MTQQEIIDAIKVLTEVVRVNMPFNSDVGAWPLIGDNSNNVAIIANDKIKELIEKLKP